MKGVHCHEDTKGKPQADRPGLERLEGMGHRHRSQRHDQFAPEPDYRCSAGGHNLRFHPERQGFFRDAALSGGVGVL